MTASPRERFRSALSGPDVVFAPLALDPLNALIAEQAGFGAVYLSGGALGFQYAVGEAQLTSTEIADAARRITARCDLPLIVDGGVGFGDPVHVARATQLFEATGAVAVEYEDQVSPKRLHHHVGIEHLVATEEMVAKIAAAVDARRDSDFLIIARTGGFRNEDFEAGIARLAAYRDAGADIVMALCRESELAPVAQRITDVPLSIITGLDHHTPNEWVDLGWKLIIDSFTAQALSVHHTRAALQRFMDEGTTGVDAGGMRLHHELVEVCGLEPWLELERRTTEQEAV